MTSGIVIGILVAAGQGQTSGTAAMLMTLSEALGPGPSIAVREAALPSQSEALRMEKELRAEAVVAIIERISSAVGQTNVEVRVHVAQGDRWVSHKVAFHPTDVPVERGRAIGLTVASMLIAEAAVVPAVAPAERSAKEGAPENSTKVDVASPVSPVSPLANVSTVSAVSSVPARTTKPTELRIAGDLTALATTGLGGPAAGIGAAAHLEVALTELLWSRVGGGAREGSISGLNGQDVAAWFTIGGAWRPTRPSPARPVNFAVLLDGGVVFHDLSHTRADGTTAQSGRILPVAALGVEGAWRIGRSWDAIAALGIEAALGVTDVWVATKPVATIPVVRGFTALGIRFGP
jgi:hypothetical protein